MNIHKALKKAVAGIAIFVIFMLILAIFKTSWFFAIINFFWFIIFISAITIVVLGTLTFVGKKDEAKAIINMFLQGSITAIDFVNFINMLWKTFIQMAREAMLITIPYLGVFFALASYLVILSLFKFIGQHIDATIPTILLTVLLTFFVGTLTLKTQSNRTARLSLDMQNSLKRFKSVFIDSLEVVILLLFLTIDSTRLFFLPPSLNTKISAQVGNYDLMVPSFVITDHFGITIKLIAVAIMLELLRRLLRTTAVFRKNYIALGTTDEKDTTVDDTINVARTKVALKQTVAEISDDFLMFAAFTLFTVLVFIAFPRLKLVTLVSASSAALLLDIVFRSRLTSQGANDLLSRIFKKLLESNPFTNRETSSI